MEYSQAVSNQDSGLELRTLADRTYQSIKMDIICGDLPQGAKIVESDLALKYGTSRGPLREAIHRLEQTRLITRIPHAGSRVVILDTDIMQDIYVARECLEGMAARLAARHMSAAEIESLYQLLEEHAQTIHASADKSYFQHEGNIDFHYRIAAACQNQWIMEKMSGELYQLIRMCRHQSGQMPSRAQIAIDQHRQIVAAIAQGDEDLAEMLMRRHISSAWKVVKTILEREHE